MGFSQALSGVNAASQQLDVVGNNIANSQTSGFKSSSVQFADVFANSQIGLGTRVSGVLQDFSNGNLETTGRNLDLAISGTGFFRFEQNGQVGYSRNGQLTMTAEGDLVNAQGAKIMGYGLSAGPFSAVVPGGQPVPLNIPADDMPAQATGTETGVQASYNLDQSTDETDATARNTVNLDDGNPGGFDVDYHYSNSFTVYDSLGNQRNTTMYFEKTANPNEWNVKVGLDGVYDSANDFTLTFDNDGQLSSAAEQNITFTTAQLGGDPADLNFTLDLKGTTQFANDSTQNSLVQDGYSSGSLIGISIADDGTVMRNYTNEKSVSAGQIVLANFRNPEGLKASGDNMWAATSGSGAEVVGTAGVGQFGSVEAETLESSNVDLTSELVNLIIAQRNYQANTNSIRTQSEVMDQIAQLR
ncbi:MULTISPECIES: flagellar hook protein FlgE [unclassified Modicisalibacter]|uniref:flagellar hook protein FlgE n=1 Tax=unclassified Modicisalibacter TaxID=2679913 RepID=UPI001CCAE25D|nr:MULTISPECIES: flagellar hook protein FlgE [unclassified Modicisalibacter]MBZ9556996.1 flagellar hook protein FlgE [Modicisalibacter sp. R2A 31.J]MBZ9574290.1 flagellar hook protein FlgE [Modicisalibacter sp. MOD 31.J]